MAKPRRGDNRSVLITRAGYVLRDQQGRAMVLTGPDLVDKWHLHDEVRGNVLAYDEIERVQAAVERLLMSGILYPAERRLS